MEPTTRTSCGQFCETSCCSRALAGTFPALPDALRCGAGGPTHGKGHHSLAGRCPRCVLPDQPINSYVKGKNRTCIDRQAETDQLHHGDQRELGGKLLET